MPLPSPLAALLLLAPPSSGAVGYHLLEVDALYGLSEQPGAEAGLGLSLFSDELAGLLVLGDPSLDGHRVREAWLQSRHYGPVLGVLPLSMALALGPDAPEPPDGPWLPFRYWRFGTDHGEHRALEWDWSDHLALNLPSLAGADSRRLLFGPTLGFGLNLCWWEDWKGSGQVVNTGKVTAEAGWIAGFTLDERVYSQARLTGHCDLFGEHQVQLEAVGVAGFSLQRLGLPLGIELSGQLDAGNDTYDTLPATRYSARAALVYRLLPEVPEEEIALVFQALRELVEEGPEPLPIEPPPGPEGGSQAGSAAHPPPAAGGAEEAPAPPAAGEPEAAGGSTARSPASAACPPEMGSVGEGVGTPGAVEEQPPAGTGAAGEEGCSLPSVLVPRGPEP